MWMTGVIVSFTSMAVASRQISTTHDTFELMTYRSTVGLIIIITILWGSQRWNEITTLNIRAHLLRNVVHFTGQNLWFFAIATIPLAQVFALEFTSPLWVMVLAPIILGEPLTRVKVIAALCGFVGILIVARPTVAAISPGLMAATACALLFALTYIFSRRLLTFESVLGIMFWMTLLQLIMGIITISIDGKVALPTLATLPWLMIIGCTGLIAHVCICRALELAPTSVVVPFEFARLPVIFVVGWILYGEQIDYAVALGALIIFGAIYLNVWSDTRMSVHR